MVLHYRSSAEEAAALARNSTASGRARRRSSQCDLLEVTPLRRSSRTLQRQAFGGLDILVNNASSFYPTPLGDIDEDDWDDLIGTNLKAPLFLAQAAAASLRERSGLIVNLADIHGVRPMRRHPVYCVAKAGLIMLTKSLARELGTAGASQRGRAGPRPLARGGVDAELRDEIIGRTALKRTGSAEDVARAVLFFASEAPFVTGQILAVDGGRSIGW